jgi:hypothetical protein
MDAGESRGGLTRRHACEARFGPSFLFGPALRLSSSSPVLLCSTRGSCPFSTSSSARRLFPAEVEGCDGGVDPIALQRRWARVCGAKWTGVSVCEISLLCVQ